jgi:small-conductance mechanosensitive channel
MTFFGLIEEFSRMLGEPLIEVGNSTLTLGKLLGALSLLALAYFLVLVVERGLRQLMRPGRRVTLSESAAYALSRILRYVIWAAVLFSALDYLGISLSHLAIVGGAIGVGIGFGLQNIFSNFISGIVLLMEQTLKVGDFVDLQSGVGGRVTEISIRYTRVTTNDSVDVIVPNSEFINGRVTNWTFNNRYRRIHVPFGVAYGSNKDLVREAGLAAAATVKGSVMDAGHPADVWLVGFGDNSLNFELVVWVGPELVMTPGRTQALYLWALETELAARKLEIPFPQRDLHIRSGTLQVEHRERGK